MTKAKGYQVGILERPSFELIMTSEQKCLNPYCKIECPLLLTCDGLNLLYANRHSPYYSMAETRDKTTNDS